MPDMGGAPDVEPAGDATESPARPREGRRRRSRATPMKSSTQKSSTPINRLLNHAIVCLDFCVL